MKDTLERKSQRSPYYDIHRGKTLLLKVSGTQLEGKKFEALVASINRFVQEGIKVVLVYGGGLQIDREWANRHKGPRPKIDGVGITTHDVMYDAVLPAYYNLAARIRARFGNIKNLYIEESVGIVADRVPAQAGDGSSTYKVSKMYVFPEVLQDDETKLMCVPFVASPGTTSIDIVNINADDTVAWIAANYSQFVHEVMMVTETGGVLDDKEKVVPLLTTATIDEILANRHPDIHVKGGMLQKLRQVREMLQHVAKVSITDDPQEEIENWRGRGTLCIDETQLEFGPANEQDAAIFRQAHADLVKEGKFRPRTPAELSEAALRHFCLKLDDAPLAGLSLIPRGKKWLELACLWSSYPKNGIAKRVIEEALKEAHGHKIYALTSEENAKRLFARMQFVEHGRLRQLQGRSSFPLPKALRDYDVDARNPLVFSRGLKKSMPKKDDARRISMFFEEAHAVEDGHTVFHGSPQILKQAHKPNMRLLDMEEELMNGGQ